MGRLARFIRFYTEDDEGNKPKPGVWKTLKGALIHITDALASPMQKCEVTLEPIQDLHGQDAPYPAGGGKNKFSSDNGTYGIWISSNGGITQYPTGYVSDYIDVLQSNNYALSLINTNENFYSIIIVLYDSSDAFIERQIDYAGGNYPKILNPPENAAKCRIGVTSVGQDAITKSIVDSFKIQLEEGSTATPWSPYENICPITGWTGTSVKISSIQPDAQGVITLSPIQAGEGDPAPTNIRSITAPLTFTRDDNSTVTVYDGTLDTKNRVLVSNADMAILTHTMAWTKAGTTSSSSYFYLDTPVVNGKSTASWGDVNTIASWAIKAGSKSSDSLTKGKYYWTTSTGAWRVGYGNTDATIEEFLAFLEQNPLQVVCQLNTPVTYNLSETELNRALNAIGGGVYSVTFPDTVYGGKYNFVDGKGDSNLAEVDLGTLTWSYNTGTPKIFYANVSGKENNLDNSGLCSMYPISQYNAGGISSARTILSDADKLSCLSKGTTNPNIYIRDDSYSDAVSFKTAMSGVQLVYELAEPIEIQLTPQEISTLAEENNVWSNTNGNTTIIYKAQAE